MRFLAKLLILALGTAGLISLTQTASAEPAPKDIVGLIVSYADGYDVRAPNGEITAGAQFASARDLGLGFVALRFGVRQDEATALRVASKLESDPRVKNVDLDHFLSSPEASVQRPNPVAAIRAASAPRKPKVYDIWSAAAPRVAKVKLTWQTPATLYGAKLSAFRIERSVNRGAWAIESSKILATARTATFTYPADAGKSMRFRVRAITKSGATIKVGLASPEVSITPTAAPAQPKLSGYLENSVAKPVWVAQSASERGGLATSYTVTATPTDTALSPATCTVATVGATTCTLATLQLAHEYRLQLVAKNSRGSSPAFEVVLPADPYFYQQWYLFGQYGIQASKAWTQSKGAPSVVVAVLDTGITNHAEFAGQLLPGFDFVTANMGSNDGDGWDADPTDPGDFTSLSDNSVSSWHGTHVAGLVAAASNGAGITGVAPGVKLLPVRIMGAQGGSQSDLVAGVNWASGFPVAGANPVTNPNPAKVINISMGTPSPTRCGTLNDPTPTLNAFQAAVAKGVTLVTSAGNGDEYNHPMEAFYSYPGNCLGSINVGATGSEGNAASYSNYGLGVDISAPGGDSGAGCNGLSLSCAAQTAGTTADSHGRLLSTVDSGSKGPVGDEYQFDEGTSMAAPLVAGAIALIYSVRPNILPNQVWDSIKTTAAPFKTGTACYQTARDENLQRCGAGIIDIAAALEYAKSHF